MKFTYYVGIDVSKASLDLCLLDGQRVLTQVTCANEVRALKKCLKGLFKRDLKDSTTLLCAEHTGMYIYALVRASTELNLHLWLVNPTEIKLSSGIQRGKNDLIDSIRIAKFAYRFKDKAILYEPVDQVLDKLRYLNSEREMLVTDRAKYLAQLKDQSGHMPKDIFREKAKRLTRFVKHLTLAIHDLERQLNELIGSHKDLQKQFQFITSIDGVGPQVAIQTIISTRGFTLFNNPRKFCHAGVAPFAYTSGSSQRSRWKVSHQADKRLKKLFHMAALSVIQPEGEFRDYFYRKVQEGKNKMTVINAIRAKIIHRIFAVVRDERKYEKNYIPSLLNP